MNRKMTVIALMGILLAAARAVTAQPTMGWSSWNTYRVHISDSLICAQADAIVAQGLAAAGYNHVNIDDGFFGGRDAATGSLIVHPARFPRGLKPVADHIHALGLRAGLYSDAGRNTCGNFYDRDTLAVGVGLYGHEREDADFYFRQCGFDFIKVDFCGGNAPQNSDRLSLDERERYTAIRDAIRSTGRTDVRLNVCRWDFPGTWVTDVASSWRISRDIRPRWSSVRDIIRENLYLSAYAEGGHFNDMDMLEVGRTLTAEEDRTHFGLWCIMASPLLIGCDLTTLRPETQALLTNPELISLNQDPLCRQAYVARAFTSGAYALVKDIEMEESTVRAVALYNPTDSSISVSLPFADIDLGGIVHVRDLFERRDLGYADSVLAATLPPHATRIYRLRAEQRLERTRYEAETAWLGSYQELSNPLSTGTAFYEADARCSGGMKVVNLGGSATNDLQWRNVQSHHGDDYLMTFALLTPDPRSLTVEVNGQAAGTFAVASDTTLCLDIHLRPGRNTIRLLNPNAPMPDVDLMTLTPFIPVPRYGSRGPSIASGIQWHDQRGLPVSAHGANILHDGDCYYLFGEYKTDSANVFTGFSCYSSTDLVNWRFERIALKPQRSGLLDPGMIGERPKVLRCPATGEYVMLIHADSAYRRPRTIYATARRPAGPYRVQGELLYHGRPIRKWDIGSFADDDGHAYLLVHHGDIYRLASDFHSLDSCIVRGVARVGESPAMFKHRGRYYWLSSHLSSWERNDNICHTATSLSGPWTPLGEFCPRGSLTWNSQTTFVLPIPRADGDTLYMYMGDRWSYPRQHTAATYVWQPFTFDSIGRPSIPRYEQFWSPFNYTATPPSPATVPEVSPEERLPLAPPENRLSLRPMSSPGDEQTVPVTLTAPGSIALTGQTNDHSAYAELTIRDSRGRTVHQTSIDCYSLAPATAVLHITPRLPRGRYILTLRVSAMKPNWSDKYRSDYGSSGYEVNITGIRIPE